MPCAVRDIFGGEAHHGVVAALWPGGNGGVVEVTETLVLGEFILPVAHRSLRDKNVMMTQRSAGMCLSTSRQSSGIAAAEVPWRADFG